jgi:hypothetical protein
MASNYKLRITAQDQTKQAFNSVNKNLNKIKGALAVAFSTAVIANFARQTLELADTIGKTADSIGVSTEFLQRYQFAAQQSGLSTEEFNKGLQTFAKNVGQAQMRTLEAGKSLERIGVSLRNADGSAKSAEQIFVELFKAMDNVESSTRKAGIMADLFGRAGVKLAVMGKDGSAALDELKNSATGIIPEDTIRQAEIFNDTMNELKREVLLPLQGVVIATANSFLDLLDAIGMIERKSTTAQIQQEIKDLESVLDGTVNKSTILGGKIDGVMNIFRRVFRAGVKDTTEIKDAIAALKEELDNLPPATDGFRFSMEKSLNTVETFTKKLETGMTGGFKKFFDFTDKEFMNFESLAQSVVKTVIDELIRVFIIEKMVSSISSTFGNIGRAFGLPEFDGGGYTGSGVRSGGLDGKGGFMAMLHPNETVVDHTRGQAAGGGATVNFNISAVDAAGFDELLASRKGMITAIINNAMNQRGKMGVI